ncbi:hypothetical protein KUCAC02_015530 [Chaenocephalus aceratus]|uniref:Uncharacterized protein n=1 Tax=Chaenocephalus aceratus TaxID=36190 RepID=A0ACB9XZK5_CHAAC|nr:hypothetical protein KUCAC02_015530 [Chaenocephalus aceratus]
MMDRSSELEWILSEMSPAEMLSTLMETRGGIGWRGPPPLASSCAPQPTNVIVNMDPTVELVGQHAPSVCRDNGQELYQVLPAEVPLPYFPPPVPAAPSLSYNSKKRRHNEQQDSNRPYVRKPLNAFMWYMKEQRALVKAEVDSKDGGQWP